MFASPKSWRYFDTQNHAPSTNCYKELPIPVGPLVPYFLSQTHVRNQTLPLASSVINPKPRTAFFSNVAVTLRSSWCYVSGLISILFPWPHGILRTVPVLGASTHVPPWDQHGVAALLLRGAVVALQPVATAVRRGKPEARPEVGLSEATKVGRRIVGHLQCKWPGLYIYIILFIYLFKGCRPCRRPR